MDVPQNRAVSAAYRRRYPLRGVEVPGGIVKLVGQRDAERLQPLRELGPHAGRAKVAAHRTVLVDTGSLEREDLLHVDDIAFHARQLLDADDLPTAVGQPGYLDHHRDRRRDLLSQVLARQYKPGAADHVFE